MVAVQRAFGAKYAKDPPADRTIRGRPLTAEDDVERVRASFVHVDARVART